MVWVGLDDYKDLKIEGAKAALPIWTEFMKRAHKHRAYRKCRRLRCAGGRGQYADRPLERATRYRCLPEPPHRVLPGRHAAGPVLPSARRRWHADRRLGYGAATRGRQAQSWVPNRANRRLSPGNAGQPVIRADGTQPDTSSLARTKTTQKKKKGFFDRLEEHLQVALAGWALSRRGAATRCE